MTASDPLSWFDARDPEQLESWLEHCAELHRTDAPDDLDSDEQAAAWLVSDDPRGEDRPWHSYGTPSIFEGELAEPPMLVPGLQLGPGRPCGLWGGPGAGKNWQAQAIALAVMSGRDALELFPVECRGKVIHITYDMGRVATSLRYRQLANGMGLTHEDIAGQLVICAHPGVAFTTKGVEALLAPRIEGAALVILDNARASAPAVDENASAFGEVISLFGAVCDAAGATGLYLHHTRKLDGDAAELTIASGRGTGAITAASGTIWGLMGGGDKPRTMKLLRQHDLADGAEGGPLVVSASKPACPAPAFATGSHPPAVLLTASQAQQGPTLDEARRIVLDAVRSRPGLSTRALESECRGVSCAKARAARADLTGRGQIESRKEADSGALRWYPVEAPKEQ